MVVANERAIARNSQYLEKGHYPTHPPSVRSVAEVTIELLENLGVRSAFGVPGGAIAPLWGALERSSLEVLHFRHEAGAAFAAVEASLASDRPIAVFATAGPGITNALTGLFAARWEGAKVIFLSPSTSPPLRGRWACQETSAYTMPISGIFTSGGLFHYVATLEHPDEFPQVARRLQNGLSQPGGFTAHLSLPTALQGSPCQVSLPSAHRFHSVATASQPIVARCAELLSAGPFAIWVGFGARQAALEIRQLADRTGAAVMCSPRGKGIFPEDSPQFIGVTGFGGHESVLSYLQDYRPLRTLVLGTRLGEFTSFWNPAMVPDRGFIQVDIDPEVPGTAYPLAETLSVESDIKTFLSALLEHFPQRANRSSIEFPRSQATPIPLRATGTVRPEALMQAIQQAIVDRTDTPILAEPGNSFAWATHYLRFAVPGRYRTSTGFASMGHTVTGVVGAAAARQGKAVAIVGDGAMLMNSEVSTAVKYQIPAVWIVLNDGCYNMVDQVLPEMNCGELVRIPRTDFVQIARGMGAEGIRVERETDLEGVLETAMKSTRPFVVDVAIDPTRQAPTETRRKSLKGAALLKGVLS